MKGLVGATADIPLLTGCVGTPSSGLSSQPPERTPSTILRAPGGARWLETVDAAIEGLSWPEVADPRKVAALAAPTALEGRAAATPAAAPHAPTFPATTSAVRTDVDGAAMATPLRFHHEREDGPARLGDSDETLAVTVGPPQPFLPRKLGGGQRGEQRCRDKRFEVEVTSAHEVLGCGAARAPTARFANASSVRSSDRSADGPGKAILHAWHAPEVGLAAATAVSTVAEATAIVSVLREFQPASRRRS